MITIGQAFSSRFNAYGDWANARLLASRLRSAGFDVAMDIAAEGLPDLDDCRFVVIGAATPEALGFAWDRLLAARDEIVGYLAAGGLMLVTGLPATAFGRSLTVDGQTRPGMGLTDQEFGWREKRSYADCLWTTPGVDRELIGVLNTALTWTPSAKPLFRLVASSDPATPASEGSRQGGLFTSQLIGPLLARNPALLTQFASLAAGEALADPAAEGRSQEAFAERAYSQKLAYLKDLLSKSEAQRRRLSGGLTSPTG